MDAVPVEYAIEARSACSDRTRAEAALAEALSNARAPKTVDGNSAWKVSLEVESGHGAKSGKATIVDDRGHVVAERTVRDRSAQGCTALARAVGAWASLVLDDELARARNAAAPTDSASTTSAAGAPLAFAPPTSGHAPADPIARSDDPAFTPPPEQRDVASPAAPEPSRTIEVGLMGYLRDGLSAVSGFAGASPFATIEVAPGWLVRPSLAVGTSTAKVPLDANQRGSLTHLGVRGDFCRRVPGNYIERRGLELDVCLGGDVAHVYAQSYVGQDGDTVRPMAFRASVGPSAALRGELGANTNVELRGAGGYNLRRAAILNEGDAPAIYAAVELGVSWRFR